MEATFCQADVIKNSDINAETTGQADSIFTLSSTELSFVGGGHYSVMFA